MRKLIIRILQLYCCFKDPATPKKHKRILMGALLYFIFPLDIIPDLMGPAGYTDDLMVVILSVLSLGRYCNKVHREEAENLLGRMLDRRRRR